MNNKYFKNFILCGDVEYHCLICKETYFTIEDVEKHIRWENHRKTLKTQTYFTKFKKDSIYKIDKRFYCELCNYVMSHIKEAQDHLIDENHKKNKNHPISLYTPNAACKKYKGCVIVSDIIVSENQWHGIVKKHCILCDVNVLSVNEHVKSNDHIINLIQAKVTIENKDRCYRKINDKVIFCFNCKKSIPIESLDNHWDGKDHCDLQASNINRTSKRIDNADNKDCTENLIETQKLHFEFNLEKREAVCKLCQKVVDIHFGNMMDHQKSHTRGKEPLKDDLGEDAALDNVSSAQLSDGDEDEVVYVKEIDYGKRRSEMSMYGKENYIKLNEGGSKAYCFLCNIFMSAHINIFKQHVKGKIHKGNLELKEEKKTKREKAKYTTTYIKDYLTSVYYAPTEGVYVINDEFCINPLSLILIAPITYNPKYRKNKCYACDVIYDQKDNFKHFKTMEHKQNFMNARVVTTLNGIFLREIRKNLFHCGSCNKVIPFWDNVKQHIVSKRHGYATMAEDWTARLSIQNNVEDTVLMEISTNPDILYMQLSIICNLVTKNM